jgi:hypothetical protein
VIETARTEFLRWVPNTRERRRMALRRSPLVRPKPAASFHGWRFPGSGCCARCAAARRELLSRRGPLSARAVPAVVVSGAHPARQPCVSHSVPPCSAGRAAVAALSAVVPYRRSPLPIPAWARSVQSSGITSPERLAGCLSPPIRCSQIRRGSQHKHPAQPGAISRCNQIFTACSAQAEPTVATLPAGGRAGTRQRCRGYRDVMTTTSDPAAYFGRQVRKERTARGWNLHDFGR